MDGQHSCMILDLVRITSLSWRKVLSQEASTVKKVDKLSALWLWVRCTSRWWHHISKNTNPRLIPCKLKWKSEQNTAYRFDPRMAQDKRLGFQNSKSNAIFLLDTMPAESWVNMVKTKNDSQSESVCKKEGSDSRIGSSSSFEGKSEYSTTSCG